jgi:TRAP-type C4-dicarboxylate transport system permease small subunit
LTSKVRKIFTYIMKHTNQVFLALSGILVFLMAWIVTYGVIMRYAFESPNPWVYEISAMFLLLCGVIAAPAVERIGRNIKNDILITRFPSKLHQVFLQLIIPLLAFPCCIILTWKSWDNATFALQIGQVTQSGCAIPTAPIKYVIPVCYGLLSVVVIAKIADGVAYVRDLLRRQKE